LAYTTCEARARALGVRFGAGVAEQKNRDCELIKEKKRDRDLIKELFWAPRVD
jgi:hypothetical protein